MKYRLLKQEVKKARQEKKILAQVNDFISRADYFGLDKSKWSFYDVHIEEEVSLPELEQILNQCANNSSYYFKPVSFYAKISGKKDKKKTKPAVSSTNADSDETRKGDIQLKLTGAFVVRN